MSKDQVKQKGANSKGNSHVTYYFTIIFLIVGTLITLYLLTFKVEDINLFIVVLSILAGGLPMGFIGAFIDYKLSLTKVKYKRNSTVKESRPEH
ncbi:MULTISPECIES: hypothetical protein [Psychrobacillus]|uniref:Uncharacterized protein n=1 Tax=Psychrobacillus faecigallinarum TaxID=2762235 RepID=A0ABR8R956_9BACI|nr:MULTISPECIES: hypothetical protein [Psychrobacillus]MBD7944323.1 hypothetical protein [Psychrobacillus faecigallinarum]QEY19758.1 hypothetical protein D0S48_03100 [Psychrobacillus sp. AK 1817]QGM30296.1 hypothetical protein GI482_07870 [Bacillus sp. N3536]